jgi:hypothetical protein
MLFLFFYLLCFRLGLVLRNIGFLFFLVWFASETWVGALLEKALLRTAHVFRKVKFHITRRCSTVPLRSTGQLLSCVFVVLLRKSIPQSRNLKAAAELNVTKE